VFEAKPLSDFYIRRDAAYLAEMGIPTEFQVIRGKTTIKNFIHLRFDPARTSRDQILVKLGFFQPGRTTNDLKITPPANTDDFSTAQQYDRNASAYGSLAAKWDLVELLVEGNSEPGKKEALDLLKELSEAGDARARYLVGNYYLQGYGTVPDIEQSQRYHLEAAELGVAEAQYLVGRDALSNGSLVDASFWFGQSAAQGFPPAIRSLCDMSMESQIFSRSAFSKLKWCRAAVQVDDDAFANSKREAKLDSWARGMTAAQRQSVADMSISQVGKWAMVFSKCDAGLDLF